MFLLIIKLYFVLFGHLQIYFNQDRFFCNFTLRQGTALYVETVDIWKAVNDNCVHFTETFKTFLEGCGWGKRDRFGRSGV